MSSRVTLSLADAQSAPNRDIGIYRHLLTPESVGAKGFSLCVNTLFAGIRTPELTRTTEQGWYIISGSGYFVINGTAHRIEPGTAIFAPDDGGHHRFEVDSGAELTYVIVFSPPK